MYEKCVPSDLKLIYEEAEDIKSYWNKDILDFLAYKLLYYELCITLKFLYLSAKIRGGCLATSLPENVHLKKMFLIFFHA